MVLGIVGRENHVIPPHFFQGFRIKASPNVEVQEMVVTEQVAQRRPYIFQQDAAATHMASFTQEWL